MQARHGDFLKLVTPEEVGALVFKSEFQAHLALRFQQRR